MSAPWLMRQSLLLLVYGACAVPAAALELARGRGSAAVLASALVGGGALMTLLLGLWELGSPGSVIRARAWLMTGEPSGLQVLGQSVDRGLNIESDPRDLRLRGLGLILLSVGAAIVIFLWRAG